jgi:hypothetical protein
MKNILLIFFIAVLFLNINLTAQDKRYTKGAENGYVWIELENTPNVITDYKFQFLSSMLENQKVQILYGKKTQLQLGCRDDIYKLGDSEKSGEIELDDIVILIDEFYNNDENLVIPIIAAYCYSIKFFSDYSKKDLEIYRQELLKFSTE